jgi:hypothetical protein
MVADKIATLPAHRPDGSTAIAVLKQPEAAKLLNVSTDSVQRARRVRTKGTPELAKSVVQGKLSVSAAADAAGMGPSFPLLLSGRKWKSPPRCRPTPNSELRQKSMLDKLLNPTRTRRPSQTRRRRSPSPKYAPPRAGGRPYNLGSPALPLHNR